jgi:hypothetical protein
MTEHDKPMLAEPVASGTPTGHGFDLSHTRRRTKLRAALRQWVRRSDGGWIRHTIAVRPASVEKVTSRLAEAGFAVQHSTDGLRKAPKALRYASRDITKPCVRAIP